MSDDIEYNTSQEKLVVWWHRKRYEGTWAELYPIIRRDVDICAECNAEYLGLEKHRGKLVCKACREITF